MTVTRAKPGIVNSATFTPANPGDEILDAHFSKLTTSKDGNPWVAPFSAGDLSETIAGANQLTMTLVDRDLASLRGGTWNGVYEVDLDGVPFRLTVVSLVDVDTVTLLFEHRIIAKLREHSGYLKVSRGSMTRAQFIFLMVNEIKDEEILFVSPEFATKQPVKQAAAPKNPVIAGKAPGFTPGAKLKVKGVIATQAQLAQADALLAECVKMGASGKVMQAIICAGIQETVLGADPSTFRLSPDGYGTSGVLQIGTGRGAHPIAGTPIDPHDTTRMAHYFLIGGYGMENGGAIAYSKAHPTAGAGEIARKVENPGSPTAPYAQWEGEAKAIVEAYTNSPLAYAGGTDTAPQATGEFYRGQIGRPEDSWTAALRLAAEVQWRAFVAGRHSFYYVQDKDLMVQQARYLIDPQSAGVMNVTFDQEVGKRMVVIRGQRVAKPSSAVLTVRIDRWDAPPGTVIELAGYGPADGRWLVSDIQRPLFDATATITLHAPQAQLAEPVASTTAGGFQVSSGGITAGSVVVSTGSYVNPLSRIQNLRGGRIDMGCDYSGHGPILAPGAGRIYSTTNSGWPGGAFIGLELTDGPMKGKFIFFAENISPSVRVGQHVNAGDTLGILRDGFPNCEIGWGTGVPGEAYAAHRGGGYSEGRPTAAGTNFNAFMVKLGAPACRPTPGLALQGHYP